MIRTVFFDFDGVIAESLSAKTQAFYQMYFPYGEEIADKVKKHHLEHGGMSRYEKFKIYHREYLGIELSGEEVNALAEEFSEKVLEQVVHAPYVPGAPELLQSLSDEGYNLFVISGTPDDEMKEICKQRKIDHYFTEICGSPADKKQWCRTLIDAYTLDPREIVFIGDASTDMEAAKHYDIHFILRDHPDNIHLFTDYKGIRVNDLTGLTDIIKNIA